MAKRIIKWTQETTTLNMLESKENGAIVATFDLEKVFPQFKEFNEVQEFIVVYGLKQKLSCCGDPNDTPQEKAKAALEKYEEFIEGKLVGVRDNSGAKEAKQLAKRAKAVSEVVSLEGLITKKVMFPADFTEEDQKKLNEFLNIKEIHTEKQKAKK